MLAWLIPATTCLAQDFFITAVGKDAQGRPVIRHQADPAHYYILFRGTNVAQVVSAVDMALGVLVEGELSDDATPPPVAFYRVRQVPVVSPLDTDGDGIDDVWELRFRRTKAALNPNDAHEDHTGSGSPDSLDYQLPVAYFAQNASTVTAQNSNVVWVTLHYSKPFFGQARLLLGGTAVPGQDYHISGFICSNQTARVPATGLSASFAITLLDAPSIEPDRYLLLSILEPPATNAPASRYQTSQHAPVNHTLRVTDGDLGIYAGLLEFTNRTGIGSQPVRLALRSTPGGGAEGYLDATQSPVFRRGFTLPVATSPSGLPVAFPQPLVHQTHAEALQRSLTYTLNLGAVTNSDDVVEAPASLHLSGLSGSGKTVTNHGQLRLIRITTPE